MSSKKREVLTEVQETPEETVQEETVQEAEETTKEASVKEKTPEVAPVQQIYIGPTIKNVVSESTIFSNGLTPQLKELMEQRSEVKMLIVPVDKLAEARKALLKKDSAESICYKKLEEVEHGSL